MTDRFLTERQKSILDFIVEFQEREGISPTHKEICEEFGYSSYGTVHKHLKLLTEKGYIKRAWNQKRGVQVVHHGGGRPGPPEALLPFYGVIAAGRPIEALPGDDTIGVPGHLVASGAREHYVLRVSGDSMIEEGIHDGDLVVVEQRDEAEAGQMVVALVDDEATLKRFYPEGAEVRLQPANHQMEPIRVPAASVRIQGIVVGLMRRF
ncbi:MAG: transcriptional repressor LexA [Thermoanaerobaculia bacterium]|nr:transcriptional repressor LexA [Thermoanaerobaculia bacterium]